MAYKDERIVQIILEEVEGLDERCDGYREEIREAVTEILQAERAHRFVKTNVVARIGDLVGRVGTYLDTRTEKAGE